MIEEFRFKAMARMLWLALVVVAVSACGNSGACFGAGCTSVTCQPDELAGWCRVELELVQPVPCVQEQVFGFCVKQPKNGFAPNADINQYIWQGAQDPVRKTIAAAWGSNAGFTFQECRVGNNNPWPQTNDAAVLAELRGVQEVRVPRDEPACESCAAGACDLAACGADANCSCWVKCAFADPSLVTCAACGPEGPVTGDLVECLRTTCAVPCGVAQTECGGSSTGSGTTGPTCGASGALCGVDGEADCCGICGLDGLCE